MTDVDPRRLAQRQLEIDQARTARFPDLLARKWGRMTSSPLAFLRGAAPVFYELLRGHEEWAAGPEGSGWIVGDAHLENFGAFSVSPESPETGRRVVFDLNDFDEALRGPWRWDVLRLTTSLILAGRELGVSGVVALELADKLVQSYVAAAFFSAPTPDAPAPVVALIDKVKNRSRKDLLDARTAPSDGRRRFLRGDRYRDLSPEIADGLPAAFADYVERLEPGKAKAEQFEIVDFAFRIAGTGSLGALRVAVLTRGKGGVDGGWVFDMKEQSSPSAEAALAVAGDSGTPEFGAAERVAAGCRACLPCPPRMLGTTTLGELGMLVRRLTPQEDKLNLRQLKVEWLAPLAQHLGALLGAAHARGAAQRPNAAWSRAEQSSLIERAVALAGIHEAAYLEVCWLARSLT